MSDARNAECGALQHDPDGVGEPHVCRRPLGHAGGHDPTPNADYVGQVTLDVEILEGWLDALLGLDQDDPDIRYVVADLRALLSPTARSEP